MDTSKQIMAEATETPKEVETPISAPAEAGSEELKALKEKAEFLDKELKKVIKDRDTAKGKLKSIDDEKLMKAGEYEKLLKEKEDALELTKKELEESKTYKERIEKIEKEERQKYLDSIEDKDLKKLAEKYDLEDLKVLSEKIGKKELGVDTSNSFANRNNTKDKTPSEKLQGIYKD